MFTLRCFIHKPNVTKSELLTFPPSTKPSHVNKWYYHKPYNQTVGGIYDLSPFQHLPSCSPKPHDSHPNLLSCSHPHLTHKILLILQNFVQIRLYRVSIIIFNLSHHHLTPIFLLPFLIP